MAGTTEHEEPRQERLEELVRLEAKVSEAAEAAADAAAHAVEATKAAEAASAARAARKAEAAKAAKAAKAARAAESAKSRAGKAARVAKAKAEAAGTETGVHAPPPGEQPGTSPDATHALEVRLADDELERLVRLAAEQDLPVPDVARSLLASAIGQSDAERSPTVHAGDTRSRPD